ncbi:DMT family transporter [Endozoicomonas gorgoniicola]|uniref:DMT family transporter n=1 Tax=Endozoicomonas gorgoniicola TaxID=1234144 RepID=A0ABT3N1C5_9GAMM|nr:DMT family transporter [Endozoicomonas gorgoniicola]MCW7555420.1 DMT family transporter [Endozoicomonas gorgoniicola]
MNQRTFLADGLLLLVAFIWGSAFVAQRLGMNHIEPWAFNGIRFLIGSFALIPFLLFQRRRGSVFTRLTWLGGIALGLVMMLASGFQQIGLIYTTAGKAAFITCLYIVLVPILGLLVGNKTGRDTWLGIVIALPGLGFLTLGDDLVLNYGDMLEMIGALFWAAHLLLIARLAPRNNVIALAFVQFLSCSLFSFGVASVTENWAWSQAEAALMPLLYVGIVSTGVGYTLQIIGQKTAPVAHASIILSLETVFAVIVGYLFLNETLSGIAMLGCVLMLAGMVVSQFGLHGIRRFFQQKAG